MPVKIGINGFGRIGRLITRAGMKDPELEFVAVNDITDAKTLAHLFKYDSVMGQYKGEVRATDGGISIDGKSIKIFSERDPANIPWKDVGAEAVVESTGLFRTREAAGKHIDGGAKRVLISAPAKGHDGTFVKGVNFDHFDKSKHRLISIGSCTTNCLAPIVKVLNDSFKIKRAFMTTIHAYTNDQRILDAPHKDLRRARSAALSMIPTTTGAAKAIAEVIPDVKGKIDGCAIRVPTPVGSLVDLVADLEKSVSIDDVNAAMKKAADGPMKGVLQFTEDPIVSADIIANPHSSVFDALATMKVGDNFVKVFSWYDNEWGFSNRMIDMLKMMGD
ncbi:MAG: type I glyceraldehyde-3-phosphate dehydrogenase [Candidatus Zixiibacteriota bacterium]|nr:MAG: type I glyceraldehyde-3-phosphate dehydrogenase [candidate division Zixibacteria bacterium]